VRKGSLVFVFNRVRHLSEPPKHSGTIARPPWALVWNVSGFIYFNVVLRQWHCAVVVLVRSKRCRDHVFLLLDDRFPPGTPPNRGIVKRAQLGTNHAFDMLTQTMGCSLIPFANPGEAAMLPIPLTAITFT
jgi:hypothetical protein